MLIKNHISVIIKLLLNQFVSAIFALVLMLSTYKSAGFFLFGSVFSIAFYLSLVYSFLWESGAADAVNQSGTKPGSGVFLILFASIPALLSTVLQFAASLFLSGSAFAETIADSLYASTKIINLFFIQSMYTGLFQYFTPDNTDIDTLLILFSTLPAILVGTVAYRNGKKNFRIRSLFGIRFDEEKEKRKKNY